MQAAAVCDFEHVGRIDCVAAKSRDLRPAVARRAVLRRDALRDLAGERSDERRAVELVRTVRPPHVDLGLTAQSAETIDRLVETYLRRGCAALPGISAYDLPSGVNVRPFHAPPAPRACRRAESIVIAV
jgi:hypothetical protein